MSHCFKLFYIKDVKNVMLIKYKKVWDHSSSLYMCKEHVVKLRTCDVSTLASSVYISVCWMSPVDPNRPRGQQKCTQMDCLRVRKERDTALAKLTAEPSKEINHAYVINMISLAK